MYKNNLNIHTSNKATRLSSYNYKLAQDFFLPKGFKYIGDNETDRHVHMYTHTHAHTHTLIHTCSHTYIQLKYVFCAF